MRSKPFLTLSLPLLLSLSAVSACSTPDAGLQTYPPSADLRPPAKPTPTIDILTSAQAEARHNAEIEAWGDGMARQINRLCNWAKTRGMDISCE